MRCARRFRCNAHALQAKFDPTYRHCGDCVARQNAHFCSSTGSRLLVPVGLESVDAPSLRGRFPPLPPESPRRPPGGIDLTVSIARCCRSADESAPPDAPAPENLFVKMQATKYNCVWTIFFINFEITLAYKSAFCIKIYQHQQQIYIDIYICSVSTEA